MITSRHVGREQHGGRVGELLIADTTKMRCKVMKTKNAKSAYSAETVSKYLADDNPFYNVSSEIETKYKYTVDNKRTDEIESYKLYFAQEGVNPFPVKFLKKPSLPPFLSEVELDNLEAIEIRSNVYFRAEGVRVIK